jgi:hypothetical protein
MLFLCFNKRLKVSDSEVTVFYESTRLRGIKRVGTNTECKQYVREEALKCGITTIFHVPTINMVSSAGHCYYSSCSVLHMLEFLGLS